MASVAAHIISNAKTNNLSAISSDLGDSLSVRIDKYEKKALSKNSTESRARISSAQEIRPFFTWANFKILMTVIHTPTMAPDVGKI